MRLHRTTPAAMELWVRGAAALSKCEAHGNRIDRAYLLSAWDAISARIADAERRLVADKDFALWRRRYGEKAKPTSYDQLAGVFFKDLGFKARTVTESGDREAASVAAFEGIDHPIKTAFFEAAKLRKARDTYLAQIKREMVQHPDDGLWYVHPSFNLNRVISFRTSCDSPNYQNIPNHNPEVAEIIRRCYIPRPGMQLGEIDYGQIEVRMAVPYTQDPALRTYVTDPATDMHYDMACQIFKLPRAKVSKALRSLVKSKYVFATFYGSFYAQTAQWLWEGIDQGGVKVEGSDQTVREHLTKLGFIHLGDADTAERGTWTAWLREVDEDFWGKRFKVYAEWKRKWWDDYLRDGGLSMLTGFAINTPLDKRQVCNAPIQGSSAHCAIWSMCELTDWLEKYRFDTHHVGEIHDSLNYCMNPKERDDVFHHAQDVMARRIKKWAPWLDVPLTTECELCPIDQPWFFKHALKEDGGRFVPANREKWERVHGNWDLQCPA